MEKDNEVRKKMNDNILRIKKSLKKTEKTYKYTRKEKYNIMIDKFLQIGAEMT